MAFMDQNWLHVFCWRRDRDTVLNDQGYVYIIPDRFCAGAKPTLGRASVHTKERSFWREFCMSRSETAQRLSLKWRNTYRMGVHNILESLSCIRYSINIPQVESGVNTTLHRLHLSRFVSRTYSHIIPWSDICKSKLVFFHARIASVIDF